MITLNDIVNVFFYAAWLFVWLTLFYEAAARTNLRSLMRFGLPIFRTKQPVSNLLDLPHHIPDLMDKLNPDTAVSVSGLQRILLPTNLTPAFLVLPTSTHALEFRNGTLCRGRLVLNPDKQTLTITGFLTWPSLAVPVVVFLISFFLPFGEAFVYILLMVNIYALRKQYQFVTAVVQVHFSSYHQRQNITGDSS